MLENPKLEDFIKLASKKEEIRHKKEKVNGETVHIFSYMISTPNLFKNPIERECRGITFDDSGKILCRPFHKFFNVGEREETLPENITWQLITQVAPKIDGSLISPVIINDKVFWKSKKTFYSSIAMFIQNAWDKGEDWVRKYEEMIFDCGDLETAIFEFTSPEKKIVIDYGEKSELILLCQRNNFSGQYWIPPENKNEELTDEVLSLNFNYKSFIEKIKNMEEIEGFCLYSINDDIYKIKTDWYLKRHRLLSDISYKNIFKMIVEEAIDDFVSELRINKQDKQVLMIEKLINEFNDEYFKLSREVDNLYSLIIVELGEDVSRRNFAIYVKNNYKEMAPFLFCKFSDNDDYTEKLKKDKVFEIVSKKYKGETLFMGFRDEKDNI